MISTHLKFAPMLLQAEHNLLAGALDMEPIKSFIQQALEGKVKGEPFFYENICKQLRDRDDQEMVWKVMIGLSSYVTTFARDAERFSDLIEAIYSYDWRCDRKISIAYINLIGHIVSTNATFLEASFRALVQRLAPTEWEMNHDDTISGAAAGRIADRCGSELDGGDDMSKMSTADNIAAKNAGAGADLPEGVGSSSGVGAAGAGAGDSWPSSGEGEGGLLAGALPAMPGYDSKVADTSLEEAVTENLQARAYRIHRAVHALIHLVPSGQRKLLAVLKETFPHKRFHKFIISAYVSQMLYMCEYLPPVQNVVLDMVIEHALELDVEIVIEDSGEVKIQEDYRGEDEEDQFELEGDDSGPTFTSSGVGQNAKKTGDAVSSLRIPSEVAEMADKLDTILVLLVSFIDRQLRKETAFKERLYQQLLAIFEERVLYTYRSKFVQFIYFYVGSRVERFASGFCQRLLRVFLETGHSSMKLQSAVLYLASFMARANFVPVGLVGDCLAGLLHWANEYITHTGADTPYSRRLRAGAGAGADAGADIATHSSTKTTSFDLGSVSQTIATSESLQDLAKLSGGVPANTRTAPGDNNKNAEAVDFYTEFDDYGRRTSAAVQNTLSRHETFFCCMQAASYVLCFYGTDLAESIKADDAKRRHWERAMTSELNPLKYCLESVRGEFLRLSQSISLFAPECWRMLPTVVTRNDTHEEMNLQDQRSRSASIIGAGVTSDSAGDGLGSTIGAVCSFPIEPIALTRTSDVNTPAITPAQSPRAGAISVKNKTGMKSASAKVPVMGTGNNPLESFFPFDPCLLRKMHRSIDDSYRNWKGVPGLDAGAEFDYDHDDGIYVDSDDDEGYSQDQDDPQMQLGLSLDERRERGYTMSSNASSSIASQSDSMMLSTTPGANSLQYPNSYLAELAKDADNSTSSAGIAFNGNTTGNSSGFVHNSSLRDGVPRHGSHTSHNSNVSQVSSVIGGDASDGGVLSPNEVWPLPKPRPRLYSVGSTGSW